MPMTPRQEADAIRKYLKYKAETRRPRGRRTEGWLRQRAAEIDAALEASVDVLERVNLQQERIEVQQDLAALVDDVTDDELRARYIEALGSYSRRKGLTAAAWQATRGVDADVTMAELREAGVR